MTNLFGEADLISVYTRRQAIADGVLVDVTALADLRDYGGESVCLSRAAYARCEQADEHRQAAPRHRDAVTQGVVKALLSIAALARSDAARRGKPTDMVWFSARIDDPDTPTAFLVVHDGDGFTIMEPADY
jgi:hypothetical protein